MKLVTAAALIALIAAPTAAAPLCTDFGFAGLLAKCNRSALPPVTLASGKPLTDAPWDLQSGAYYQVEITSDGSQELALAGPEFFRAIWIDEVVINKLEVRPLALDSVEFDDEGTLRITFVAIKPGRYQLKIPGSTGDTQKIDISIK
jgi:hypothetical protein